MCSTRQMKAILTGQYVEAILKPFALTEDPCVPLLPSWACLGSPLKRWLRLPLKCCGTTVTADSLGIVAVSLVVMLI